MNKVASKIVHEYNCKECNKKKYIESKHKEKNEIDIKKCNTCNLVKTIEDFYLQEKYYKNKKLTKNKNLKEMKI